MWAARRALQHALWLLRLMESTKPATSNPSIPMYIENASEINIAQKQSNMLLRKHIDVFHNQLVHQARTKSIHIQHNSSKNNQADIITKAIASAQFRTASAELIYHITQIQQLR